jgi:hypothetical protein
MRHDESDLLAGLHAAAAGVGANAAVLMHTGVLLALVRAKPARRGTGMEHAADHFVVRSGPARGNSAGDVANISAIEIDPDALGQRFDHFLGQAGVCAGGAGLGAGIAFLDTTDQHVVGLALHFRMRVDHFLNVHRSSPWVRGAAIYYLLNRLEAEKFRDLAARLGFVGFAFRQGTKVPPDRNNGNFGLGQNNVSSDYSGGGSHDGFGGHS